MSKKVYIRATQQQADVSSKEAQDAVTRGQVDLEGDTQTVQKGDQLMDIPTANLSRAVDMGWTLVDEDEAHGVQLRREESDAASMLQGGVEALGAGATLGLSTALIDALGGDPERMRARREALGTGGTGLELVGSALPALLSGGTSAAGSGARGLAGTLARATPSGLATRASVRAGEGLAARLGSETAGKRILARGARDFVEGAAQGAGAQLDENVLGERELTADLLGATAFGGTFGVGAGMGASGLAKVATGAVRAPVKGMMGVLGRMNAGSGGMAAREVAEAAVREGQQSLGPVAAGIKRLSLLHGAPEDLAERLAQKANTPEGLAHIQRVETELPRIQQQAAELVSTRTNAVHSELREVQRLATGEAKQRNWERLLPNTPEHALAANGAADDLMRKARAEIDGVVQKNADDYARYKATTHSGPMLQQADAAVGRLQLDFDKAAQLAGREQVAAKAAAIDNYKRRLGVIVEENGGWGGMRMATPEVQATNRQLRAMYGSAKEMLESDNILGTAAASSQREINGAYTAMAQADDLFEQATKGTGLASIVNDTGEVNMQKAIKLVRAQGRVGGEVTVTRLMDAMKARVAYVKAIAKHVETDDIAKGQIAKVEQSVDDLQRQFDDLAKDASLADDLATHRSIVGNKSPSHTMLTTSAPAVMGALGLGFGGPLGMAAGLAAGVVSNPHRALLGYAALRGMLDKADAKLNGAVSGMFKKEGGRFALPKLPKIDLPRPPVGVAGRAAATSDDERTKRRETAIAKAAALSQSPDAVERELAVKHYELHQVAPGIAGTLQQRVQKQAAFLASKAPKTYHRPYSKTRLVDPVSAASFERYLSAVEDPIGTLDRFAQGRITSQEVEAIRVCYPALYADVQERIVQHLADADAKGEEIDYETRVKLGQMFDVPTDPSLQPQVGNEIQLAIGANFDEPNAAQAMAGANEPKPSGKAGTIKKNTKALATGSERTASWRSSA